MKIAIIKYNAGNIHSVRLALQREGIEPLVTDDPDQIQNCLLYTSDAADE